MSAKKKLQTATDSFAVSNPVVRPPSASMLALLCSRERRAVVTSWHNAHRMPGTLFAAMLIPIPENKSKLAEQATSKPVPHAMIPNSIPFDKSNNFSQAARAITG